MMDVISFCDSNHSYSSSCLLLYHIKNLYLITYNLQHDKNDKLYSLVELLGS
jgi:hypothetical protein